ncbi:MAG: DUF5103 domain-containing protein [Flavobacteriales bacterium]|nr:DUF5103 domain-containing protein [Bacteroidota bacterium]MCB9241981.1 DUF5103 domain-containing protein [Flavobacteriales bacterium]
MMPSRFWFILLFLSSLSVHAKVTTEVKYENYIYDDLVETVLLTQNSEVYNPFAMMRLGETQALKLNFDKLQADNEFYQYTFVHCNANWKPSNLQKTEYLEGNTMGEFKKFTFSSNTFQQYVNYELVFPETDMKPIRSGNYLLKVFRNFDENDLILTRRFIVVEEQTEVSGNVKPASHPKDRFYKQEVDFEVDYENYPIQNPFNDVNAVILQNNSWNNAIYGLKPLFVNNNKLVFNYEDENLFEGTNEFRYFDIRTLRFFSNNVLEKFTDTLINVVLKADMVKSHLTYVQFIDYNGKRVIQNTDGTVVTSNGDYAEVHFSLKTGNKMNMGDVYVYGELSDWRINPKYKMTYVEATKSYYLKVKLKQSYYNYHYVVYDSTSKKTYYDFTEGNHFETENDYTILIYHTDLFYGYDRLIGFKTTNTANIRE